MYKSVLFVAGLLMSASAAAQAASNAAELFGIRESVENIAAMLGAAPAMPRAPSRSKAPSDDIDDLVGEALAELRNEPTSRSAAE